MPDKGDFAFELAAWPVLAVNVQGAILAVNRLVRETFPVFNSNTASSLVSLWGDGNELTVPGFLADAPRRADQKVRLRLRIGDGQIGVFVARTSPWHHGTERCVLVQLFLEELAAASGQTEMLIRPVADDAEKLGLAQKQKLDCALKLARTMALDFNNTLTGILGHTSLLLSQMDSNHPWRKSLMEVEKSAEKAAEIAEDLALFSRQERSTPTNATGNLNDILRRSVQMVQASARPGVEWKLHLESRLYALPFDEAKMQQALVKILENAMESLTGNGSVVVLSRNREIEETTHEGPARLAPGTYVCVEISDTGCGIPSESYPRIFEPFYTTKQGHRGLGLAWVYGIITNHGGSVAISSQPGHGTVVRVYLPATKTFIKEKNYRNDDLRGQGTVMIVDDEVLLLTMGQMILSAYGYHVHTASDGQKALEIARNPAISLDLVLTDLVMPGMSGRELIEHLNACIPGVPIICMTGYVHPGLKSVDNCLQKPFTSQSLLSKVKEILNAT